jgi:hypothetical protein
MTGMWASTTLTMGFAGLTSAVGVVISSWWRTVVTASTRSLCRQGSSAASAQ